MKDVIVKSRFVVRGFDERLDEDANLFAATPVPTSVKAILALASKEGKCVGTADVSKHSVSPCSSRRPKHLGRTAD